MEHAIIAKDVHKTYRSGFLGRRQTYALRGIDLAVKKGELFGLLGRNGAGKTTLLNIFSCQLLPDSGSVSILGTDITKHNYSRVKTRLNMCSGSPNFPWSLTVEENLKFYALLYGKCGRECAKTTSYCLETFGLQEYRKTRYDQLSSGNKQKLALAKSLINDPEVLFLDEPTIGLDVSMQSTVRSFIRAYNERFGASVLLTSHYMEDVAALCPRVVVIDKGRLIFDGALADLVRRVRPDKRVVVKLSKPVTRADLEPFGRLVSHEDSQAVLQVPYGGLPERVQRILALLPVLDLSVEDPPLEEVFRELYRRSPGPSEAVPR